MTKCNKKCEVYTRIVGYMRPVANWNRGKKQEYGERKLYSETTSLNSTNGKCSTLKVSNPAH
jgi:ribonucleoside-triphosphate reductase (formate)